MNSEYRYERKCLVSELSEYEIESLVKLHPAVFREVYHPRYVNNLYFDSVAMGSYLDNVDGYEKRVKVRIRWYGELFGNLDRPMLELKIKKGAVGKKESFALVPFSLSEYFHPGTVWDVFSKSKLPQSLKVGLGSLSPSLLNRYRRKYFQTIDQKYRITIDTGMEYYGLKARHNVRFQRLVDFGNTVIEIKYALEEDLHASKVLAFFPFRMTKNSKYVTGVERTNW